ERRDHLVPRALRRWRPLLQRGGDRNGNLRAHGGPERGGRDGLRDARMVSYHLLKTMTPSASNLSGSKTYFEPLVIVLESLASFDNALSEALPGATTKITVQMKNGLSYDPDSLAAVGTIRNPRAEALLAIQLGRSTSQSTATIRITTYGFASLVMAYSNC